jgi:hypothetical protein
MSIRRRLLVVLLPVAALVAAVFVAGGRGTQSARAGSSLNGLSAYVVPTNTGPLSPCSEDGSDCTAANAVWQYIHVVNRDQPANHGGNRLTVPNAFVVDSIDEAVYVNGVHQDAYDVRWTPPPYITPSGYPFYSGKWPATVTCDGGPPCTNVQNPAAVPGEDIAIFISGWAHGNAEPNGNYVFRFTIHGTLNGNPVDLTATEAPIRMTS